MILDATLLALLVGLAAYRITKILTEDDILAAWRKRHNIGGDGYRCPDGQWHEDWPDDPHGCEHELSCEQDYRDAVQRAGERPWPMSWVSLLSTKAFWVRAFSCNQCASVWVSGALATVTVLALAVTTGTWTWLLWWPLVASASAGLAARLFL